MEGRNIVGLLQGFFKTTDEIAKGDTENSADLSKFKQIKATRSGFIIADKCLRLTKCTSHVNLTETRLRSELAEER
jgi:hypothetical protein